MPRPVLALLLIAGVVGADLAPGHHRRLPCPGTAYTIDCFLPTAYGEQPARRFPVLFVLGPGGSPGTLGLDPWAERRGVLLVMVNDSRNTAKAADLKPVHEAAIATAEATLRLHPCLRFATGHSGAATAGLILAGVKPDQFAGVLLLIHSGNYAPAAKHLALGFIAGSEDTVHPVAAVREAARRYGAQGNPVRASIRPGGHDRIKPDELEPMLDWMLDHQRLCHPRLARDDVAAAWVEVRARIAALPGLDAAKRSEELAALMAMPPVATATDQAPLRELWATDLVARVEAETDPVRRHQMLVASSATPGYALLPLPRRQDIDARLATLRRTSPVKEEWEASSRLAAELKAEPQRWLKGQPQDWRKRYQDIATTCAQTEAGQLAVEHVKRLDAFIEKLPAEWK